MLFLAAFFSGSVSIWTDCLNMNIRAPLALSHPLMRRPHLLLGGHLLMLHILAFGGWRVSAVRLLWLVALGLFLLWQPFVAGERRISLRHGSVLSGIALISTLLLGPWLLLIWGGVLASVIGGRVLWTERRSERIGYLLAFGYLVGIVIFGAVPEISPAVVLDPELRSAFAKFMPVVLPALLLFPAMPMQRRVGDSFDLFYGMLVFLVLAVFVMGALAYMLLGGIGYIESLFKTSMVLAGALLLVAWAWNPKGGFSGIGSAVSRYLLSVGMPIEQWLVQLSEANEQEQDPERFLSTVLLRLHGMTWVQGVTWQSAASSGKLGDETRFHCVHQGDDIELSVFFMFSPSPAMLWHVKWLLRLAVEFYLVKRKTHELRRMGYLQAVYETGARVTHDVKNLLQSMQTLCYAASQPGDPDRLAALLGRQLPQIADRLRTTLEKLQSPQKESQELISAENWWLALRERYAHADVLWHGEICGEMLVPKGLFDSVAENLLQNALAKRQRQPGLEIRVSFGRDGLKVFDSGLAITANLVVSLLRMPVDSEDGLGIGLFHAARQAESMGYRLSISDNRDGCVSFKLSREN